MGPSKKRVDDLRRRIKGWLEKRPNLAVADSPDYHFVFATTHGNHSVYVGLHKDTAELHVLYIVDLPREVRERLKELFPSRGQYERFVRELGRDLMEGGCGYNFKRAEDQTLSGYHVIRKLYPFDDPGITRQSVEDAIQNVVLPGLRGIYYLTDLLGMVESPADEARFEPGPMFG